MSLSVKTSGVKDDIVQTALNVITTFINKISPFSAFQYVTVTFNGTANVDTDIKHTLNVRNPEAVDYHVVRIDRAAKIYNDQSATRKAWQKGLIYLRSDTASAVATILLVVRPS